MMSIRWIEETDKRSLTSWHTPSGNSLIQGSERTIDFDNLGGFRALTGDNNKY